MNDVIGSVRQVIQDFLAPELRQHRAELVSIRSEIGSVRSGLTSRIDGAESRLESKINVVDSKIDVLKSEMCSGFSALDAKLENAVLRGEPFHDTRSGRPAYPCREIGKGTWSTAQIVENPRS